MNQAVILCGGLGTRLSPVTKNIPKPMVDIAGKPFLLILMRQLSELGINKFLLLTGYRSEIIENYFKDGSQFGLEIKYSVGPANWTTSKRVFQARNLFDEKFLLLYADNFANVDIAKLIALSEQPDTAIVLSVSKKISGNVKFTDGNFVRYSQQGYNSKNTFVDVGYMIVSRDKFFSNRLVQESIHSNLSTIIEKFSEIGLVSAVQIKGEYLSISDPERLEITREFLKFKKIILLDRDGIINVKMGTGKYVTDYADFIFIQDHISVLEYLSNLGYSFIVITNQACINLGKVTIENLNLIHESMIAELNRKGINIIDIYLSPDHWKNKSGTRKPNPDLFFMASKFHSLWLEQTIYIGDEIRDVIASKNAGCGVVFIDKQFNSHLIEEKDVPAVNKFDSNLGACTNFILEHYSKWESIL